MDIGKRLMQERKRLGLSQVAFAKQVGVSLSSQKRYELGEREPDISYLERAIKLGVDISYILTNTKHGQSYYEQFGIDEFVGIEVLGAIAKLIKFTKEDFLEVMQSVETKMQNDFYRNLSPAESVLMHEEFVLVAVSKLLNKKIQNNEFLTSTEVDYSILSDILESIELSQQKNNFKISPYKKSRIAVMLYRSFKASGNIDHKLIEDTVSISAEPLSDSRNDI